MHNPIQLTEREAEILCLLNRLPEPKQFDLDWLHDEYFGATSRLRFKRREYGYSSLRSSLFKLGLKLVATDIGAIHRVENGRGRRRMSSYVLIEDKPWKLTDDDMTLLAVEG